MMRDPGGTYFITLPVGENLRSWIEEYGRILSEEELDLYYRGVKPIPFDQFIGWSTPNSFKIGTGWIVYDLKTLKAIYASIGRSYASRSEAFWFIVPSVIAMAYTEAPVF